MKKWTRKNRERLNANRRQANTDGYGIKICPTCKEDIPYNGNNRSYSKLKYCSPKCHPSQDKEHRNRLLTLRRRAKGIKPKKTFANDEERKEWQRVKKNEYYHNMSQEQRDRLNAQRRKHRKKPEIRARERQELRDWHENNPHKSKEYYEKSRKDPIKVLRQRMSNAVRNACKHKHHCKKTKPTFDLLNFTKQELYDHLESQFTDGMNWDNMNEWHIDHIIPVTAFKIDSVDHPDFHTCWALGNLRPMWAKDNLKKGNKIPGVDYI